MEKEFIKLTNQLYKLLEFFPEHDPLKNRAKDRALVIMENLTSVDKMDGWTSFQSEKIKTHTLEDIDALLGYLWIAKSQGWLNAVNYLIIVGEYKKIAKTLKPFHIEFTQKLPSFEDNAAHTPEVTSKNVLEDVKVVENPSSQTLKDLALPSVKASLSTRQEKILDFLKKSDKAQVMDLQTILPDVTKRTIRRDLDELLEQGKIDRFGEFNEVFYSLRHRTG